MGRALDRHQRILTPSDTPSVATEVYPTSAASVSFELVNDDPLGSNVDDDAGFCVQCGWPIENLEAERDCPLCGSDNFRGEVV